MTKLNAGSGAKIPPIERPLLCTLAGGLLLWSAFPPLAWSGCAWFAPIPWLLLARSPEPAARRFYSWVWLGSILFWVVLLQGIRKAHWANHFSLLLLSSYLAAYLPAFVAVVRCALHVWKVPLFLAAPVAWTGLELLRGYLFTGFSVALLGHTQVDHTSLIQLCDLTGAYGVSFLVMLCAASLAETVLRFRNLRRWLPITVATAGLAMTLGYGQWRLRTTPAPSDSPLRVALLQGTRDKVFYFSAELERKSFAQYCDLQRRARDVDPNLDLIVWPEGAFTELLPELIVNGPLQVPADSDLSLNEVRLRVDERQHAFAEKVRAISEEANRSERDGTPSDPSVHLLVGVTSLELHGSETRNHNSALWIDPAGKIVGRYHKMHLVMLGEYVPFVRYLPGLAQMTPIGMGLTPGDEPESFAISGYDLAPSICFECTVPHLIRAHCRRLARQTGKSPDVLVSITDDGWFWGTSILDLHLACSVFRAVEMRRPFLVAANTGISAAIDGNGRVLDRLPHRREGFVLASISRDGRFSLYEKLGDVFAGICLLASAWWGARGWNLRRNARKKCGLENRTDA